jgi:hypothetical protein
LMIGSAERVPMKRPPRKAEKTTATPTAYCLLPTAY